jgi:hypothetical protein
MAYKIETSFAITNSNGSAVNASQAEWTLAKDIVRCGFDKEEGCLINKVAAIKVMRAFILNRANSLRDANVIIEAALQDAIMEYRGY